MKGVLYLIPNRLSDEEVNQFMPVYNSSILHKLKYFIVENLKPARALLKSAGVSTPFQGINFFELNKRTTDTEISEMITVLLDGHSVGLITDAGYPAVADPGEEIVFKAHQNEVQVVPLTGPSSILFAVASSGLNAEKFTFHAYLPVHNNELVKSLKKLERNILTENYTHVFIETPYRSQKLFEDILKHVNPNLYLTVCADLNSEKQYISTQQIAIWKKMKTDLNKKLVVFVIGLPS
ncbi:MAG: SAM-dependent methyltransferase [Bacteroidetes bacterium]|jgi:16S rRNA (cytidine1402-2'-O)-methyltransferase|nr:SAM-dependent methyltransferase [Bacteroidota bacterium]MBT5530344.1 SAM-dependent methyltransferase [Cytophagia bacterium]MBT3424135.1 SAM-dependent methyltransferase [Bacteroidota bacterium]MBT3799516.1 SAM-dependent methyltransferase [Bacteroidota bacterium]MBT3935254.1 SAM-dependent methyltransferase [Bacteroidota bacterium]